ncbi:hypothetical protein GWK47_047141 [Chionoecetes opilio]|uniref:Uncharacterized protein n=1 Tax=Chionoecetes opilio TaxID=41210 RepID=A0A8J5CGI5_CHIOP|nr:hypothetical protein GWK47_047141 [Chionoecetes opilio]
MVHRFLRRGGLACSMALQIRQGVYGARFPPPQVQNTGAPERGSKARQVPHVRWNVVGSLFCVKYNCVYVAAAGSQTAAVLELETACPHLHQETLTQEVIYLPMVLHRGALLLPDRHHHHRSVREATVPLVRAVATITYIWQGFLVFIFLPLRSSPRWKTGRTCRASITATSPSHHWLWGLCIWPGWRSKGLKTSVKRSAEEIRKLMQQTGLKNHDPTFLRQHSKGTTVNLMLQLSNFLAIQEVENSEADGLKNDPPEISKPI